MASATSSSTFSIPNISTLPFLIGQNLWRFVDGTHPCPPLFITTPAPAASPTASVDSDVTSTVVPHVVTTTPNPDYLVWYQTDQTLHLADQLASIGQPVQNDDLVTYVLNGLGPEYEMLVLALTNFPPLPSFNDLCTRLLVFESKHAMKQVAASSHSAFYSARHTVGGSSNGRGGHSSSRPNGASGGNRFPRTPSGGRSNQHGGCWACNQFGHIAALCPQATRSNDDISRAFAGMHLTSPSDPIWYPDTGATHHMTSDARTMTSATGYGSHDKVVVGSGEALPIAHTGNISFESGDQYKGYRCLHPPTGRVYLSRHVIFNEDSYPYGVLAAFSTMPPSDFAFVPIIHAPYSLPSETQTLPTPPSTSSLQPPVAPLSAAAASDSGTGQGVVPPSGPGVTAPPASGSLLPSASEPSQAIVTAPVPYIGPQTRSKSASRSPEWRQAMSDEFNALLKQRTWSLVPPVPRANIVGCKWVFKLKQNSD
ncbi:hypothetical protein D8674_017702 [Pyrus ussuriensis x Pyrus communis]|uniref:CCHC-type domain-containing protein n=1 Tax=Pyrus ussuriensis x Pyrus communis TaxID=2448454 RepID=A0A5N5HIT6_9ROSA|nr:hypothetical protein D8674_017702 [Pyrus ussuriensis x Pyrus communis]